MNIWVSLGHVAKPRGPGSLLDTILSQGGALLWRSGQCREIGQGGPGMQPWHSELPGGSETCHWDIHSKRGTIYFTEGLVSQTKVRDDTHSSP